MPRNIKSSVFNIGLCIAIGSLAGMLVKSLALGALGGLLLHLIVIGVSEYYHKDDPEKTQKTTPEQN